MKVRKKKNKNLKKKEIIIGDKIEDLKIKEKKFVNMSKKAWNVPCMKKRDWNLFGSTNLKDLSKINKFLKSVRSLTKVMKYIWKNLKKE